jgi:DNA-binding transcriptional MerR regulator
VESLERPRLRRRIGELARATGVTVRTLHHYEQVGLLRPAGRTEGGHRLYDETDVERLYRIRALRALGLSLDDVRRSIDEGRTLTETLRRHLVRAEDEAARATALRDRLRRLCSAEDGPVEAEALVATIAAMSRLERHAHARRRARTGQSERAARRWRELAVELRACQEAGEAPGGARGRALAARAQALIHAFAEGQPTVVADLARVRAVDPPHDLAGWDPELMRYLDRALGALTNEGGGQPC